MRIFTAGLLLCSFLLMLMAQSLYEANIEENNDIDIYNLTNNMILWNSSSFEPTHINETQEYSNIVSNRLNNIILKTMDWVGYSCTEIMKTCIEFGYTHPQYNYSGMVKILKYVIIFWICCGILSVITPICALIYLCYKGIKKLHNKIKKVNKNGND